MSLEVERIGDLEVVYFICWLTILALSRVQSEALDLELV